MSANPVRTRRAARSARGKAAPSASYQEWLIESLNVQRIQEHSLLLRSSAPSLVETNARLRGQIAVKEIQISAMRTFAAERNPDLKQAQQELEAMKGELAKIEGTVSGPATANRAAATPEGMENLRLLRDVKYHETIFELLAKQRSGPTRLDSFEGSDRCNPCGL